MDKLTLWVAIGSLRKKILTDLNKPKTATKLSKELQTHRSTINQILRDFDRKGLIKKLNPEAPFNVFYERTAKGNKIVSELDKLE